MECIRLHKYLLTVTKFRAWQKTLLAHTHTLGETQAGVLGIMADFVLLLSFFFLLRHLALLLRYALGFPFLAQKFTHIRNFLPSWHSSKGECEGLKIPLLKLLFILPVD